MTFPPLSSIESLSLPPAGQGKLPTCHKAEWLAEILDMPRQQIYNALGDGKIPLECVVRIGRRIRFKEAETLAWIKSGGTL